MDKPAPMRARILAATEALLVEEGAQASMSRIAERAGVAAGSIYNHFASKQALIRAVYEQVAAQHLAHMRDAAPEGLTPLARLERYIDRYIAFFQDDPARAILFELLSNAPLIPGEEMIAVFACSSAHITGILEDLQAEGALVPGDPAMMGGFIGGAMRNTLKWRRVAGRPLSEADRAQIRRMCLNALLREG